MEHSDMIPSSLWFLVSLEESIIVWLFLVKSLNPLSPKSLTFPNLILVDSLARLYGVHKLVKAPRNSSLSVAYSGKSSCTVVSMK